MSMKKIMIMAGGTGGHVFPGLAVAEALRAQGHQVCWLGTRSGIEARLVPAADIPIHYMDIAGVRGKGLAGLLKAPFRILRALLQSAKVIRQEKPHCVLGMGGFVAGPGAVAAKLAGIPLVIHEQNAIAGTTNRILSRLANRVLQAFPGTFPAIKSVQTVGNPVRHNLPVRRQVADSKLHVLIVGGSLGAKAINDLIPQVISQLANVAVWHQTGKAQQQDVQAAYNGLSDVRVDAFIDDMPAAYGWADILICRSGAMTVSEVAAVGLPAIFIPFPFAIDDHQTANANILVNRQAAVLMPQHEMNQEKLTTLLQAFQQHPEQLDAMAASAAKLGVRNAAGSVMSVCLEVAR